MDRIYLDFIFLFLGLHHSLMKRYNHLFIILNFLRAKRLALKILNSNSFIKVINYIAINIINFNNYFKVNINFNSSIISKVTVIINSFKFKVMHKINFTIEYFKLKEYFKLV